MIQFKELTIKNFLSYGNVPTVFNLDQQQTVLITGENGAGKAQPLTSKVLTPYGWKLMNDIEIGDVIYDYKGNITTVVGVYPQGQRLTYKFIFEDDRTTEACIDHLWNVFIDDKWYTLPTKTIIEKLQTPNVDVYIPLYTHPNLLDDELPIQPYVLGNILGSNDPISYFTNINSHIKQICTQFNITDQHRPIPSFVLQGSTDTKLAFINGVCDEQESYQSISTSCEFFAKDFVNLVRCLGGIAKKTYCAGKFTVSFNTPNNVFDNEDLLQIKDIIPMSLKPVQCIKIASDNQLYVTDDYVVTHNTTIINALTFALYGKPISDIAKDDLVNNINKKGLEVTVTFNINEDQYFVRRVRKEKAGADGNYVQLHKNGKDISRGTNELNKELEKILGIPFQLFIRIITFTASHTPFLELPTSSHYQANQTDIIEELFDIKILSEKADKLKEKIKQTKIDLDKQKALQTHIQQEIKRHSQQIDNTRQRLIAWDTQHNQEIEALQTKLSLLDNLDVDLNEQYELTNERNNIQSSLKSLIHMRKQLHKKLTKLQAELVNKQSEITHLQNDACPYCHQPFHDTDDKLHTCVEQSKKIETNIKDVERQIIEYDDEIDSITQQLTDINNKIVVDNVASLIKIQNEASGYKEQLKRLQMETNPFKDTLNDLQQQKLPEDNTNELQRLSSLLEHQQFLVKLLTKKDSFIRKKLLDKNIPFLNKRLKYYLRQLNLSHNVEFTHQMTAKITQFQHELKFGNLSTGQKAKVNIALSFAFRDVIQQRHGKINVCLLDEVFDVGLDTLGVQDAGKMIKTQARNEKSCHIEQILIVRLIQKWKYHCRITSV